MKRLTLISIGSLLTAILIFSFSTTVCAYVDPSGRIQQVIIGYSRLDGSHDYKDAYLDPLGRSIRLSVTFAKYVIDLSTGSEKRLTADHVKFVRFKNLDNGLVLKMTRGIDYGDHPMFIDMGDFMALEYAFYYGFPEDIVGRWKVTVEYKDGTPKFETILNATENELRKIYAPKIQNVSVGTNSPYNPGSLVVSFNAGFGSPKEFGGSARYFLRILDQDKVFIKHLGLLEDGNGFDEQTNTVYFTIPEEYRGFIGRVAHKDSGENGIFAPNGWPAMIRAGYWFLIPQ